ncbi:MFS transporter [Desulfoscipio geothermicus]|uniref:MFS transporter, FSR family, fosmidomycin resistance protein n=1 Tax=Desulfoscipio geothermicus DSM 3669 TaxID=1121426 RepID=A0A1I6D5X7_9FIRM|nr:MFS transporter [Desulfoscipio geothermicus]SFR00830.1 MFS transporter, FSR family, fosmidomycin resistance protein [Desulfoscipio geothermicus DSM 3669]
MKMNKKVLALLSTGHAITDITQGAIPMMLTFLQPAFVLSQLQVGIVMLAFNLSSSVIQPIFGIFSDRFRAAWLVPLGCLLAGLGMAFTGYSPNYMILLIAALVSGLGVAAYHPEGSKFARFASGSRKASGMALFSVGGNIGFAAGPVLASFLFGLAGLRGSIGFLGLNGAMALLLWIYLSNIMGTQPGISGSAPGNREQSSARTGNLNIGKVIVPVILLVLVVTMRSWVHFGMVTFLPQYFVHYLQRSEVYAATLTSVFLFAGAFGTIVGGPAADRWGFKNVIIGSTAMLLPLLFLFVRIGGIWTTVIVALAGFLIVSTFAVTVVFGQELLPNNVGLASGLMLGFAVGMGGVGTTLLGWVADQWGLPAAFQVMIIFPVIGLLLALFLPGQKELARNQESRTIN